MSVYKVKLEIFLKSIQRVYYDYNIENITVPTSILIGYYFCLRLISECPIAMQLYLRFTENVFFFFVCLD